MTRAHEARNGQPEPGWGAGRGEQPEPLRLSLTGRPAMIHTETQQEGLGVRVRGCRNSGLEEASGACETPKVMSTNTKLEPCPTTESRFLVFDLGVSLMKSNARHLLATACFQHGVI